MNKPKSMITNKPNMDKFLSIHDYRVRPMFKGMALSVFCPNIKYNKETSLNILKSTNLT